MQHGNMNEMPASLFRSTRLSLLPNLNQTGSMRASAWDVTGELICSGGLMCVKICDVLTWP